MSLTSGDTFAGYEVQRRLGAGGMGEVYLVRHPRLPRLYALKTLSASLTNDVDFRARFSREAELAAELSHPHIVGVHDRGEYEGRLWIAMDYVEGVDALELQRKDFPGGIPETQVAEIVTAVADALDYAHARRLLHRDVKPANILIDDSNPKRRRILLADFGVARRTDDISGITATNTTIGSVAYAPPEQLMGQTLDGRADQYALAATAYHLLTGNPPFQNSNPAVVISGHLNVPPPPLAQSRPDLKHLDGALARGLAKNRDARYASCREFADELAAHVINDSVTPPPVPPSLPPPPPPSYPPPPAYMAPPITYPTQAAGRPTDALPPAYWEQQPPPAQSSLLKPAVLIPAVIVLLVLLGAGAYGVVQLVSTDSSSPTSSTPRTASPPTETDTTTAPSTRTSITAAPPTSDTATTTTTSAPPSVSGIGQNRSFVCNDDEFEVSGIDNTVTITGHCKKVTVSGQQNKVIIDSTDAIDASGINNDITYHTGNPTIDHGGIDVTVRQG